MTRRPDVMHQISNDVGYMKSEQKALHEFLTQHMQEEEKRFKAMHRWMAALTIAVVLQWLRVPAEEVFKLLVSALA